MDVSLWKWNASVSKIIPIRPRVVGHMTLGAELLLLQQVLTVRFKSESCPKCQFAPPSLMQLPDEISYN